MPNYCWTLFKDLEEKFRTQYSETLLCLQYQKHSRHYDETAREWMGRLKMKAMEYKYIENDRQVQSISGVNDETMTIEIKKD